MKRSVLNIASLVLIFALLLGLTACGGGLKGTYTALGITLTFKGDRFEATKGESSGSGTYRIEESDGGDRIYFTFEEGEGTYQSDFSSILIAENGVSFEKGEGYIRIAGIPFAAKE